MYYDIRIGGNGVIFRQYINGYRKSEFIADGVAYATAAEAMAHI